MSNTWGALSWGTGSWGNQSDISPAVTGISASFSIGEETITTEINTGWGRLAWGEQSWGSNEKVVDVAVTGVSMTSSLGDETAEGEINSGWGRQAWGNSAWGEAFSVEATGQSITSSIGTALGSASFTAAVSGIQSSFSLGSFSLQIDQDITVFASEDQLDFTIGTLSFVGDANVEVTSAGSLTGSMGNTVAGLKTPVDVSGIAASFTLGSFSLVQSTTEPVTGISSTMSLGSIASIPDTMIGVSGISMTSSLGEEGPVTGNALVQPTGISLTSSVGSVNITAWSEIDLGVTNTWTVVDLAA
tara:strand:+ start:337 stop:1242 length:906 start_codon:yes stop_codon:yes gene_type:complete